ncbi:stealth family protein [Kitasatospora sp. NPDC008050]|uniref:stealth family protein n=1 Tax=Kitasatospora sp. NPDC008050 TaxID=3364021 RepID=UPI0036E2750F
MVRAVTRRARRVGVRSGLLPRQRVTEQVLPSAPEPEPQPEPEPEPQPAPPTAEELRWQREERLLEQQPALVRHDGLVTEVRDDLLSGDAFLRSFTEVTELLIGAELTFAPMRGQEARHWVVIAPGQRAEVLATLAAAFAGQPVYADLLGHDVTLRTVLAENLPAAVEALEGHPEPAADESPADEQVEPEHEQSEPEQAESERVRVKGVRIYRPVVTSGRTLVYGPEHGCDLDFWDSAAPSSGAIAAIHEPPFGWWVPSLEADATVRIGGREYPAPKAFARPLLDDVTFPVDAVVTWVDDSDPVWRGQREATLARMAEPPATGSGTERFHNRDELRYCLRSIAMYAPWIRQVFLVTDGQQPDWLETAHPGLTVVSHRELYADPSVLPVFNSHSIETQLHRIPELAEHFLYFNDDMFLGRPVRPEQFFQGNGSPLVNLDSRVIPPGRVTGDDDEYVSAQKNTRELVRRAYGRDTTNTLSHVPYPLTRTLLAESAELFDAELSATARSTFRSATDVAPVTLAVSHGYLSSHVGWGRIGHRYVDVDRRAALEQLPGLLHAREIDTFCLNDGALDQVPRAEQDRLVTAFLQAYFPVAGPFENTLPEPVGGGQEPAEEDPVDAHPAEVVPVQASH